MVKNRKAFTLVEMAVSMVIIAVLVAAALKGGELLRTAKLQAVLAEIDGYETAINSFKSKYNAFPGDFSGAEAYWGTYNVSTNPGGTYSGDADGKIEYKNGSSVYEGFRAWQHMTNAKVVQELYRGSANDQAAAVIGPTRDVPESKAGAGSGFFFDNSVFGLTGDNVLVLGVPVQTSATPVLVKGVLAPKDAHFLDVKMDDGEPAEGILRGQEGNGSSANSCVSTASHYSITLSGKSCTIGKRLSDD